MIFWFVVGLLVGVPAGMTVLGAFTPIFIPQPRVDVSLIRDDLQRILTRTELAIQRLDEKFPSPQKDDE